MIAWTCPQGWVWQNGGVVDGGWGGARRLGAAGGGVEGSGAEADAGADMAEHPN